MRPPKVEHIMNNKVNMNRPKVPFSNLKEILARRLVPIHQEDIANKTRFFGRKYSRPAVAFSAQPDRAS